MKEKIIYSVSTPNTIHPDEDGLFSGHIPIVDLPLDELIIFLITNYSKLKKDEEG